MRRFENKSKEKIKKSKSHTDTCDSFLDFLLLNFYLLIFTVTEESIQIKRIQQKLQQLLKQYDDLRRENRQLSKELQRSKEQISQQKQTVDTLKQQVEVLKISSGNWNEKDKKEFEKRINFYLKEIDRCIALLGE